MKISKCNLPRPCAKILETGVYKNAVHEDRERAPAIKDEKTLTKATELGRFLGSSL